MGAILVRAYGSEAGQRRKWGRLALPREPITPVFAVSRPLKPRRDGPPPAASSLPIAAVAQPPVARLAAPSGKPDTPSD